MSDPAPSRSPLARTAARLKSLLARRGGESSLRQSIEEAIEEHEAAPAGGDLDDIGQNQRDMLRRLLDYGELRVDEIAVPRADIIAFDVSDSFDELVTLLNEAGHSRIPVFEGTLDVVLGFIHVKDVFAQVAKGNKPKPETLIRSVLFVAPSMRVIDLLAQMRASRIHLAIVIDEWGGADGLVTIEDVVEQIIGDIEDEHDDAFVDMLRPVGYRQFDADARLPLEELEERLGVDFLTDEDDSDVDTLGGLVFMIAGRVPAVGEIIVHPSGYRFEIVDGDPRRVRRLRLHQPDETGPANTSLA